MGEEWDGGAPVPLSQISGSAPEMKLKQNSFFKKEETVRCTWCGKKGTP